MRTNVTIVGHGPAIAPSSDALLRHAHRKGVRYGNAQAIIRRASRCHFNAGILGLLSRREPDGRSYKLRDDEVVPLICPTCQNVFAG